MLTTVKAPRQFEALFRAAEKNVARYFHGLLHDPGKGTVDISGDRYLLIRTAALSIEFFDTVRDLYKDQGKQEAADIARQLLFDIAHALGREDARHFHRRLKLTTPIAKLSAGPVFFAHAGWAQVKIFPESQPVPNEDYYLLYDHPYSFEADAWLTAGKHSDCPVCIMNAGYSSGWCEESFGVTLVASEILCRAKGDEACRFVMAPPSRIQEHIARYLGTVQRPSGRKTFSYEIPGFFKRKQMEKALRISEERYRNLFNAAPDGILVVEAESACVVEANRGVADLLGMPHKEMLGRRIRDLDVAKANPAFRKCLLQVPATAPLQSDDIRLQLGDGRRLIVSLHSKTFLTDHTAFVLHTIRDLTGQRRAEEELRLAARVFDASGEGIVITDSENRIVSINRAFTETTGYTARDALGQDPRVLSSGRQDKAFYRQMWSALRRKGHWSGEILNRRKSGELYPEWLSISTITDSERRVINYVAIFSDITERKTAEERVRYLAEFDVLTGLANRYLLNDRLGHAIAEAKRQRTLLAVLFLDLDHFKTINDSLGHGAGDELLRMAAKRLVGCLRDEDTVARMGGDEFLVLLPNMTDMQPVAQVAEKIREQLSVPFALSTQTITITTSIGISIFPADGKDPQTLIKNADTAMYRAKELGRDRYEFFTQAMAASVMARLIMEHDLRQAIASDEFFLLYQPQFNIVTGEIIGIEALLRWRHPKRGVLQPADFITFAEQSQLIQAIDAWTLRAACSQNRKWQDAGLPPLPIAVNISGPTLQQKDFPRSVGEILKATRLPPKLLELEISETILAAAPESTLAIARQLTAKRVLLSLDHFGAANSSLRCLSEMPIAKVKIGMAFVQNAPHQINDSAVVRAILAMARTLNIRTLAEGPETAEQIGFLEAHHCEAAQGHYYSKPLAAAAMTQLMKKGTSGHRRR